MFLFLSLSAVVSGHSVHGNIKCCLHWIYWSRFSFICICLHSVPLHNVLKKVWRNGGVIEMLTGIQGVLIGKQYRNSFLTVKVLCLYVPHLLYALAFILSHTYRVYICPAEIKQCALVITDVPFLHETFFILAHCFKNSLRQQKVLTHHISNRILKVFGFPHFCLWIEAFVQQTVG